ncbi:MAG: TonB-dependent receptor [Deltaproteobacteria bacterium]|nr:TonB-dependent receptor [Deltaproteobacteria bacterium]
MEKVGPFSSRMLVLLSLGLAWTSAAPAATPPGGPLVASVDPETAFVRLYFDPEDLVVSATRAPKPIDQVAENVTVVTADEIRDMNAHTLGDVLKRIPGVFTYTFGNHFGATPLAHIQGSGEPNPFRYGNEDRHVLVLLDGVPWSSETAGPFLNTIPVGPIERIEIIKGPASSIWGSSLGGVINVITKGAGAAKRLRGEVAASYGERRSWDTRGEVAGAAGPVGYYAQAQAQNAEWDQPGPAGFEETSAFAKVEVPVTGASTLDLAAGAVDVDIDAGRLASQFALAQSEARAAFGRVGWSLGASDRLGLRLEAYRLEQRLEQHNQEDGTFAPRGDLLINNLYDEEHTGVQARATWAQGRHVLVAGVDYRHTDLRARTDSGDFFQSLGNPARFEVEPGIDRWGVYLNDTIRAGRFTFVPGVRYDDSSRTDPFWSPSLGLTVGLGRGTLLRADAARGFSAPPLTYLASGGIGFDPNPDLDPEEIWSFQAGVETAALPGLWLKLTGFRHEVGGAIRTTTSSGPNPNTWENRGTIWRTGYEIEAETARLGGVTLRGGFAWVRIEVSGRDRDQDQHQAVVGVYYDPDPGLHAEAVGRYVWWDLGPGADEGDRNDFLWDLNLRKTLSLGRSLTADLFATVHNLFNGNAVYNSDRGQEPRWLEAGIRMRF